MRRHEWYRSLDEEGRHRVGEAMREAVDFALASLIYDLDNMDALDDARWGYSLYVQSYEDDAAFDADRPSYRSRKLNLNNDGPMLGERYWELLLDTDEDVRRESAESRETMRKVAEELRRREAEGGQTSSRRRRGRSEPPRQEGE